jgi:UDP-N-acetylglucosamine 2-epimerase (non-hydrolysing)
VTPLKIMAVFGTRPDTIKMAPVVRALRACAPAVVPIVCVSAQHRKMLDDLLALFKIVPDYDLDIMTPRQTLTQITTRVLERMEPVLHETKPDVVLVHGDTTTSTSAALAAFYQRIPVGHVEAGLRTGVRWEPYPEEMNRRLTGAIASYHFAPTSRARMHLEREHVDPNDIFVTGNTVIDAFLETANAPPAGEPAQLEGLDPKCALIFVTAHRRENHDRMRDICLALRDIAELSVRPQILWPVHPSPQVAPIAQEVLGGVPGVRLVAPMTYDSTVRAIARSRFVPWQARAGDAGRDGAAGGRGGRNASAGRR